MKKQLFLSFLCVLPHMTQAMKRRCPKRTDEIVTRPKTAYKYQESIYTDPEPAHKRQKKASSKNTVIQDCQQNSSLITPEKRKYYIIAAINHLDKALFHCSCAQDAINKSQVPFKFKQDINTIHRMHQQAYLNIYKINQEEIALCDKKKDLFSKLEYLREVIVDTSVDLALDGNKSPQQQDLIDATPLEGLPAILLDQESAITEKPPLSRRLAQKTSTN